MRDMEEVMEALYKCKEQGHCTECKYFGNPYNVKGCISTLLEDVACLVTGLQDKNRALQTELEVNNRKQADEFAEVVLGCKPVPDQTAKQDDGKLDPTLVPPAVIWAIAAIRRFGLSKYRDRYNYRNVEKERLRAAAYRHFLSYIEDPEKLDNESGLPNLWHLATNIAFLCELENYDVE